MSFAVAGIKYFYSDRQLWKFIIPVWGIMLLFYILLLWGTFEVSQMTAEYAVSHIGKWPDFLRVFLKFSIAATIIIASLVLVITTFCTFFEAAGGMFFDKLAAAFEQKYYLNEFAEIPFHRQLFFTMQSVWFGIKSVIWLMFLIIVGFFLPIIGPLLLMIIMGRRMALSLIYPVGFLRGMNIRKCNEVLYGRNTELLGFGIAVYLFQLLPFSLLLTLPGLILGAVIFYHGRMPSER